MICFLDIGNATALENFSRCTCRYCNEEKGQSVRVTSRRDDCWTAQRCMVVILVAERVEYGTLPACSSLVVCRCRSQRSAHCRHRHRRWCVDRITDLIQHVHVYRVSAATRRSANKPWCCRLLLSNIWADCCWCSVLECCWCSVLESYISLQIRGRWFWFFSILVMMCRCDETLVFVCLHGLLHRLDRDEQQHLWRRLKQCGLFFLQHWLM